MEKNNSIQQIARIALLGIIAFIPSQAFAWNRIVTLNPMVSEWVAEIIGNEQAKKKLVGASEYSNYPEWVNQVPTVGPYPQIQIEKVLSLHPDLVIASIEYNRPDQIEKLKQLKLNVITLPKESFLEMDKWILELGKFLKEDQAASVLAEDWNKSLRELKAIRNKKRAFFQIQFLPLISVGGESFLNDSFKLLGFENIFEKIPQAYPKVSREAVLEKNPEKVFVFEMVKDHEDLEKIKLAWKKSDVQVLSGDDFSRCSRRLLRALKGIK
jgi:iron complex transport system substrate-binding protein